MDRFVEMLLRETEPEVEEATRGEGIKNRGRQLVSTAFKGFFNGFCLVFE